MIANNHDLTSPKRIEPTVEFEDLLPKIQQYASRAFRFFPESQREELVAETVANAFCAYTRLVKLGKSSVIYATPLAQFSIRQVRSGRRVGTKMNVHDITSEYCRLRKNIHVERLDQFNSADGEWMEQVVEDKRSGPAETAAMRIDFTEWLSQLPKRIRQIAKRLAVGESTGEVANCFQVSSARVSQLRRELHTAWNTFQSEYSRDPAETNA